MDLKGLAKIKDEGNELFKLKKYQEAIAKFNECIQQMEGQQSKEFLFKQSEISKLYVICLINAALACISSKKIQKYDLAIQLCDKALSIDSDNVKGLYRRGLARREKAQIIERQQGVKTEGLLNQYQKAKQDFEKLCLIDKNNQLATKNLSSTIKDIYRVTMGRGQQVQFKSSQYKKAAKTQQLKSPYQIPSQKPQKKGSDMNRIMKEYKVQQVTNVVQQKVRSQYLASELPSNRTQLQKAIRTLQKSQETYIEFVYRMSEQYLNKIQPSFDTLASLVSILLRKGKVENAKTVIIAIQKQKSFRLLWKSFTAKEKEGFQQKWKQYGLPLESLAM